MKTLKFLGRGSAFNTKEGNTSAYIKENDTLFLIDCGSNIFERIMEKNLLDGIKNVYVSITHMHPDHIGSLGDLIFYCYYKLGIKVNLLDTDYSINEYLLLNGITDDKYNEVYNDKIKELDIGIKPIFASHCQMFKDAWGNISDNPYNGKCIFDCYSFVINYKDKQIFYSGDCNFVDWFEIRDCDEFYVDTCLADYEENVHYNVEKLNDDIIQHKIDKSKIHCMHLDCDELIDVCKDYGLNVIEVE